MAQCHCSTGSWTARSPSSTLGARAMNIRHGTFGRVLLVLSLGLAVGLCAPSLAATQASQTAAADKPFVVEYYYKARWGYADEFIRLFKKNHWPVLKKEMELGRILQIGRAHV